MYKFVQILPDNDSQRDFGKKTDFSNGTLHSVECGHQMHEFTKFPYISAGQNQ